MKAGIIEPEQYASQFGLAGELHIRDSLLTPLSKSEVDSNVESHYYVKLNNVKYGLFNGRVSHSQSIQVDQNIDEEAQQIENPFVIVYHNGKVNCLCFYFNNLYKTSLLVVKDKKFNLLYVRF